MSAIERHARHTPGFETRLAATVERLQRAASAHAGRIVQASSLGVEDMVVTDLLVRHRLPVAVATLNTGKLHAETLALMALAEAHYGLAIERFEPVQQAVVQFVSRHGEWAMRESIELRKACCVLRKLEPLARMLEGREQSDTRAELPFEDHDDQGRAKHNVLADWSLADVWFYVQQYAVPTNTLHDRFYPSIGCEPCTRAVAVGEDFRAGRWWWEQASAKECGLHVSSLPERQQPAAAAS
jgi:phosphoadenosine phosphosulfate reductase